LVVGASGGTGHVALQVAKALGAKHATAVCSRKSEEFCLSCGADDIVDYHAPPDELRRRLLRSPGRPYDIVMDCVTSADPRDRRPIDYPEFLQQTQSQSPDSGGDALPLLAPYYVYRRLGGPSADWIRAGLERTAGVNCWTDRHEKLFWIRFPDTKRELRRLSEWAEAGALKPHVSNVYDFSTDGVKDAFDAILSRRVRGKVVVKVMQDGDEQQEEQEQRQLKQQDKKND